MEDIRSADPQLQNLRAMMEAWRKAGITVGMSCQRLIEIAQSRDAVTQSHKP
jgi:hypothetical protein